MPNLIDAGVELLKVGIDALVPGGGAVISVVDAVLAPEKEQLLQVWVQRKRAKVLVTQIEDWGTRRGFGSATVEDGITAARNCLRHKGATFGDIAELNLNPKKIADLVRLRDENFREGLSTSTRDVCDEALDTFYIRLVGENIGRLSAAISTVLLVRSAALDSNARSLLEQSITTLNTMRSVERTVDLQAKLDIESVVEPRVDALLRGFGALSSALADFLVAAMQLYLQIEGVPKQPTGMDLDFPDTDQPSFEASYERRVRPLKAAIQNLSTSLSAVGSGSWTAACIREAMETRPSLLAALKHSFDGEATRVATPWDLEELRGLLTILYDKVDDYRVCVVPQWAATNMSGGNGAGSVILFAGNLLLMEPGDGRVGSVGAAMLVDVARLLPSREIALTSFSRTYESVPVDVVERLLPADDLVPFSSSLNASFDFMAENPERITFPPNGRLRVLAARN